MTASTLKGAIKGTLKGILNTAAPVFSRRSAMDSASARETLLGFSPPPTGTAGRRQPSAESGVRFADRDPGL